MAVFPCIACVQNIKFKTSMSDAAFAGGRPTCCRARCAASTSASSCAWRCCSSASRRLALSGPGLGSAPPQGDRGRALAPGGVAPAPGCCCCCRRSAKGRRPLLVAGVTSGKLNFDGVWPAVERQKQGLVSCASLRVAPVSRAYA